jgi:hypothetical protein
VRGFLIDTNALSEFSRRLPPDRRVKCWLGAASPGSLYVSVLTAEVLSFHPRANDVTNWSTGLKLICWSRSATRTFFP